MADPRVTTTPDDAVPTRPWRGLLATAHQLGAYAWTERRLFELLGAWSVLEHDPAVKVLFDAQSHEHAWHADVVLARLPELREVDVDALLAPPDVAFAALVDQVAASASLVERVVGLHGFLVPHLVEAYRHELAGTTTVAGASLRRWLPMILDDLSEEMARGDELTGTMLDGPRSRELADRARRSFGEMLSASGGLLD